MRDTFIDISGMVGMVLAALLALLLLAAFALWARYRLGIASDRRRWWKIFDDLQPQEIGAARKIRLAPLVEWRTAQPKLASVAGLSYLLEIDGAKVLFDLGGGKKGSAASPLRRNLDTLGVEPAQFTAGLSALVISHRHREHGGGFRAGRRNRIDAELDFSKTPCFSVEDRGADQPRRVLEGALVSARLPGRMFTLGRIEEQMLVINLEGKGLVFVVADAHPEVMPMLEYAERITGIKPYAYIGGLHALMNQEMPWPWRWLLTRRPPWRRSEPEEVGFLAVMMRDAGVKKVFASAHDSDDFSLGILTTVFGDNFRILAAGDLLDID